MPEKHKFKCLHQFCNVYMFVAMTSPQPKCPKCSSIKCEDFGPTTFDLGQCKESTHYPSVAAARDVNKRSDVNLRRVADRYGLTNMNNKDGQAVKRAAPAPASNGPMTSVGGYQVPASATGGCHRLPVTVKLAGPQIQESNPTNSKMLKGMTRVVAEHKGKA